MESISAETKDKLLQQLSSIDISMPRIDNGRKTEHCERWSICRLLATITKHQILKYPIKLVKHERPDFRLYLAEKQIGIEITEAIQPDYARARVLPEARSKDSILDASLFKWGDRRKNLKELREIASKDKLTGPGWCGDDIEVEWSDAIFDTIKKKTNKLNSSGFGRYSENWLSIYDNLNSFGLDTTLSSSMLLKHLHGYWQHKSFDKIYVETGEVILEFSKENTVNRSLNDLWKN